MSVNASVAGPALAGALLGAGTAAAAYAVALHPWRDLCRRPAEWIGSGLGRQRAVRAAGALGAGALAAWATSWPVAALIAAAAVWWLPRLLGPDRAVHGEAERIEAVAAWAEQLRDMISGSAGLHQAVSSTAPVAPAPIRSQVLALDARLRSGQDMEEAAAEFARGVDNETADLVAAALAMGASRQAGDLAGLLGRLAESARDRATLLGRTSASRARVRSSVRIITAVTAVMAIGMAVFNRDFLTPYDTVAGQAVLALVGAVWGVAFVWLARLARPPRSPRFLAHGQRPRSSAARAATAGRAGE